jgi:hypothetical protein
MNRLPLLAAVPAALTIFFTVVPEARETSTAAAQAAESSPVPPAASSLASARQAVSEQTPTLGRFFASKNGTAKPDAVTAQQMAPKLAGPTIAVYYLNPAFVTGHSDQVAQQAFLATEAVAADGATASVWTAQVDGRWKVVNIASGTDEETYAKTAGLVFREPQIDAWYTLSGGHVRPLNLEARRTLGAATLPLASYQRLVQHRYGDKLPGSAYARKGLAGGFGTPVPVRRGGSGAPVAPLAAGLSVVALAGAFGVRRLIRR